MVASIASTGGMALGSTQYLLLRLCAIFEKSAAEINPNARKTVRQVRLCDSIGNRRVI
jgi:hypothetical protein